MAHRSYRRPWAAVVGLVGCLVVSLVASLGACGTTTTGSNAVESTELRLAPSGPTPAGDLPAGATVRVLQLNLCSSGIASCYTGRSTAEATAVIRAEVPDLVTLNEICRDDLSILKRALADIVPGGEVTAAFQAAGDRRTSEAYRCRNGQQYGIGVISRWPSAPGSSAGGGIYPVQDTEDPEERAWLCMSGISDVSDISTAATTPTITVCTTHLAYTKRDVAAAQCRYLFETVIAELRERGAAAPLVLGADLNLGSGDSPDVRTCVPAGFVLVDDGGQQHVVATPEFVVDSSRGIDLGGTTDHPALLVTLAVQSRRRPSRVVAGLAG